MRCAGYVHFLLLRERERASWFFPIFFFFFSFQWILLTRCNLSKYRSLFGGDVLSILFFFHFFFSHSGSLSSWHGWSGLSNVTNTTYSQFVRFVHGQEDGTFNGKKEHHHEQHQQQQQQQRRRRRCWRSQINE